MIKQLTNTTASDIFIADTGTNLIALSTVTVSPTMYPAWAASNDVISYIASGAITVSDGNVNSLGVADSIALLQGNFKQLDFIAALKDTNRLKVDVQFSGNQLLKVTSADQTSGYLGAKVVAEPGATTISVINPGADEDLQVGLPAVGTASTYGSASQVPVFSTDTKGRVSSVVNTAISIVASAVTDFSAAVRLVTLAGIAFTTSAAITATDTVLVAFGKLQAQITTLFGRTISAGTGLTGGGDLTADRTISMPNVGTAGSYGSSSQTPVFTTDAQGRVSSVTNTSIAISQSQVTSLTTDLANKQPLDADLTSISALTTIGIAIRSAANTWITRVLSAGNGITIGNADGVAGNPTITAATPYFDHYHGTTRYNATQLRKYSNIGTSDSNGRVTFQLTTTGIAGGTALFTQVLSASPVVLDGSGTAIQGCFAVIETISATAITYRLIRGTSTGVLLGGTVVSAQFAGAGYSLYVEITGVRP